MIKIIIALILIVIICFLSISIIRRWRTLPCPSWLSFLLENPYMESLSGSPVLIERIDLRENMRVLDVGCGPGRLTVPFAKHVGAGGEVVALDIQEKMLSKLSERVKDNDLTNVRFISGGAGEGILQEENYFDCAILVTVLGEIPDKKRALEEIYHALKPEGILSITEVLPDPDFQRQGKVLRLAAKAGFTFHKKYGNRLAFTMNFMK